MAASLSAWAGLTHGIVHSITGWKEYDLHKQVLYTAGGLAVALANWPLALGALGPAVVALVGGNEGTIVNPTCGEFSVRLEPSRVRTFSQTTLGVALARLGRPACGGEHAYAGDLHGLLRIESRTPAQVAMGVTICDGFRFSVTLPMRMKRSVLTILGSGPASIIARISSRLRAHHPPQAPTDLRLSRRMGP